MLPLITNLFMYPSMKYLISLSLAIFLFTGCLPSSDLNTYDDTEDRAFYEDFAAQEGVTMTDSGLLYRVIEEGDGDLANEDNYIFVTYTGNSIDGFFELDTEDDFDVFLPSDFAQFTGLAEAALLMSAGANYELVLPTELAVNDGRYFYFDMHMDSYLEDPETFLATNAERDDVQVTESGLQYRVIEEGEGEKPQADDLVEVRYRGTFTNGYVFDESENAELNLEITIQGFTEGLQLMSVGSTYELFMPSDIAYGDNTPPNLLPGAILVFEVELLDIVEL